MWVLWSSDRSSPYVLLVYFVYALLWLGRLSLLKIECVGYALHDSGVQLVLKCFMCMLSLCFVPERIYLQLSKFSWFGHQPFLFFCLISGTQPKFFTQLSELCWLGLVTLIEASKLWNYDSGKHHNRYFLSF